MQIKRVHWLIGIALVLGALFYFDVWDQPSAPSPSAAQRPGTKFMPGTSSLERLARLKLTDLTETLERPLFQPTRRAIRTVVPPPQPVGAVEEQPPPPPVFKLLGVIISGDRSLAVLTAGESGTHWLDVGDSLSGWEVVAVHLDAVVIARGSERQTLRLTGR
jgi:hypothetical protein